MLKGFMSPAGRSVAQTACIGFSARLSELGTMAGVLSSGPSSLWQRSWGGSGKRQLLFLKNSLFLSQFIKRTSGKCTLEPFGLLNPLEMKICSRAEKMNHLKTELHSTLHGFIIAAIKKKNLVQINKVNSPKRSMLLICFEQSLRFTNVKERTCWRTRRFSEEVSL